MFLSNDVKQYLIRNKKYIIYEHDHKYVKTRDPSKFINFEVPKEQLINVQFYEKAECVVVLSQICKEVLSMNIPNANVHSIGCSLWSDKKLAYIASMSENKKFGFCIMKSNNPTKNYINTIRFCEGKKINNSEVYSLNGRIVIGLLHNGKNCEKDEIDFVKSHQVTGRYCELRNNTPLENLDAGMGDIFIKLAR